MNNKFSLNDNLEAIKIYIFIALTLLVFFIFSCKSKSDENNQITTITKRDINQEVIFSTKVSPSKISNVFTSINGIVENIKKTPGSKVNAGDIIMIIKDNNAALHSIVAKEKGTLLALNYSISDYINSTTNRQLPLFTIGNTQNKIITAEVDEIDAAKIHAGDTFFVLVNDSFSLPGKLDYINILASSNGDPVKFKVSGRLNDTANKIKQFGNSVTVKVIKLAAKNVLSVESNYLVKKDDKNYLNILNGKVVEEKEIITGVENNNYTEIRGDVKEGEIAVKQKRQPLP